jgi:hypothetical protein
LDNPPLLAPETLNTVDKKLTEQVFDKLKEYPEAKLKQFLF